MTQWGNAVVGDVELDVGEPIVREPDRADRTDVVPGDRHRIPGHELAGVAELGVQNVGRLRGGEQDQDGDYRDREREHRCRSGETARCHGLLSPR